MYPACSLHIKNEGWIGHILQYLYIHLKNPLISFFLEWTRIEIGYFEWKLLIHPNICTFQHSKDDIKHNKEELELKKF